MQSTISYYLMKAGMFATRGIEDVLASTGLTTRQFLLLGVVAEGSAKSQQDVSRALHVDPTIVVGLIDELEAQKLLVRQKNPDDRRRYVLSLTAKGTKVLKSGMARMQAAEDTFLEDLSPADRSALQALLSRVMQPKLERL